LSPGDGDGVSFVSFPDTADSEPGDPESGPESAIETKETPSPSSLLDLVGEICPFTFVRAKLALEQMAIGDLLRVVVDHEPATRNIPRSAAEWGQEVIAVAQLSPHTWAIDLRKRVR
jgi:TusA-related sulfurtransferase